MTEGFQTVLAASEEERRDLFVGSANRLRTNEQNIEKDFWVCWTLDALFNELEVGGPRLLFKGGTLLSKGLWFDRTILRGHRCAVAAREEYHDLDIASQTC